MAHEDALAHARKLIEEVERLRREVTDWRECALYDPLMEGPRFKGWNRSALERCREAYADPAKRSFS